MPDVAGLGPPTDEEVLAIMVDGAEKVCDHALEKWYGDSYHLGEETRSAYIRHWAAVRRCIRPLRNRLLAGLRNSATNR